MLAKLALLLFGVIPPTIAHAVHRDLGNRFVCGTTAEGFSAEDLIKSQARLEEVQKSSNFTQGQTISVDLYVHIIAISQTEVGGWISQQKVDEQVQVLRSRFTPAGIDIVHKGTQWHYEPQLGSSPQVSDNQLSELKLKYHIGDYKTLNIYIVKNFEGSGFCPLPQKEAANNLPNYVRRSGCGINTNTLPGGDHPYFNQGLSAVHEVGHWFGLWHVFEAHLPPDGNGTNGCEGVGDEVDDTPAMFGPEIWCDDLTLNTCPDEGEPRYDPLDNLMGYTTDSCKTAGFTPGQVQRMFNIWNAYKA